MPASGVEQQPGDDRQLHNIISTVHGRPSPTRLYLAFAAGDREAVDGILSDQFTFSSPVDVGLNRAGYFDRCWSGAGQGQQFEFVRLVESADEVIVTYEMTRRDGVRGRNTEVLTFEGDRIVGAEVYFDWNL